MTQARRTRQIVIGVVGLILLGACQKHVSLSDMQPLHQSEERITARLAEARREGRLRGAMVLATCNRFEILVDTDDDAQVVQDEFLADYGVPVIAHADAGAVAHLIRVAAGLESMVLGEDQIVGQVGQAFRESDARGMLGKGLHMVYSRVMRAARKARQSRPAVSAPRSVAELGARICREAGARVAIIGAGTTAQTAAESLRDLGATELHFANRTRANAERLAAHFGGTAGTIDELLAAPPEVEAVIAAINGRELKLPVAKMPSLQTVVDISQPAVLTGVAQHPGVRHLDLDALAKLDKDHEQALGEWSRHARLVAEEEAARIWHELDEGKVDLSQLLGLHVENATAEVDRALRGKLRSLPDELAEEVRKLAERVARRNAHLHLSDVKHFARP